jgi:cytochrome c
LIERGYNVNRRDSLAFALLPLLALPAAAQFTYPGCADLKASDFRKTELFTRSSSGVPFEEPVQMGLHGVKGADGRISHVDIYFVGRKGRVRVFKGDTRKVQDVGTIDVWAARQGGNNDNGLMGIAVDPAFDSTRRLYFWYSPPVSGISERRILRLTRIALGLDGRLDMASEKVLIEFRGAATDTYHSGGPMQFDSRGDLWIQVGNQSDDIDDSGSQFSRDSLRSDEWGPSNTANLRGSTLRIHPDESERGYRIPSGNFGEYWAAEFEKQDRMALAAEYRDPGKVLPEIYIKGERSNYSIGVHPTGRWMAWGSVNYQSAHDEFNVADHPVFSGFPYFHGENARIFAFDKYYDFQQDPNSPRNESPLSSGVKTLPPAYPGSVSGLAQVAIGGGVYAFDPGLDSETKFPPHLDNTFVGFDFNYSQSNPMWLFKVDPASMKVTGRMRVDNAGGILAGAALRRPLQALYGPEGSLYVLNYDGYYSTFNPGVMRFDYVGPCRLITSVRRDGARPLEMAVAVTLEGVTVREAGRHVLSLHDVGGARLYRAIGGPGEVHSFAAIRRGRGLDKGVYLVKVRTDKGELIRSVYLP